MCQECIMVFIEYNIKRHFSHSHANDVAWEKKNTIAKQPTIQKLVAKVSNMLLYKLTNKPFSDGGLKTVL